MITSTRRPFSLLACIAAVIVTGAAKAGPADDLLPPPVRQAEKRSLSAMDQRYKAAFYDGRGMGAAFSPDGKLLIASAGHQGTALLDVASGRVLANLGGLSHNEGLSAAFTPDGKQIVGASWGGHNEAIPSPSGTPSSANASAASTKGSTTPPSRRWRWPPTARPSPWAAGWGGGTRTSTSSSGTWPAATRLAASRG